MGLERFLEGRATIMEGDNLQAGKWASSDMMTNGNKFIERDYHKVKEWVVAGYIEPRHVSGKRYPSNLLTKPVDAATQNRLGGMLSGRVELNPVSNSLVSVLRDTVD